MGRLLEQSPQEFAARLRATGRRRACVVRDPESRSYSASDPGLDELAEFLRTDTRDCWAHEAVFLEVGAESGELFAAFLHKTARGQAQGGLRRWPYARMEDLLRDGLRLSADMTRKIALAGLWWGGGKGLIARHPGLEVCDPEARRSVYREYGDFITSLRGCYVTAQDAGTRDSDLAEVFRRTRFATCIPVEFGGSGNPSQMTAAGVVCAMEAALEFRALGSLVGKKIAIQGAGNVGAAMIEHLLEKGAGEIVASEISAERIATLAERFDGCPVELRLEEAGGRAILSEPCHVLSPSALGGVLGPKTIPGLRARIVCASANNPLIDPLRDGRELERRGITYVPDFVANRMGIVACSNEQYGTVTNDPTIERHLDPAWPNGIYRTTLQVLELSRKTGETPLVAASRLADALAEQPHPIWDDRARRIVASLMTRGWA